MNKIENKFNLKTFFMFFIMLVLSLSMVLSTACGKGGQTSTSTSTSEPSSESTSEEAAKDEQLFANGDFEFPTDKKPSTSPITLSSSSTKWTGSVDGEIGYQISSSNVKRGIIDVSETVAEGEEKSPWEKLTSSTTYKNLANPGTPLSEDNEDTDANEAGTRLLMLYNSTYAAQFVTSSTSLKVPANEYGKLTLWVYTDGLERYPGSDAGAYIKVKNTVTNPTVSGATYDPLVIENIDTWNATEEKSEWKQYTIYLAPNTSKTTSYTVILGLGEGNKLNVENHVKGFAFFDNVIFELIDKDAYDAGIASLSADANVTIDTSLEEYALTNGGRVNNESVVNFSLAEGTASELTLGGEVAGNLTFPEDKLASDFVTYVDNTLKFDFSSFNNIGAAYTYESDVFDLAAGSYVRVSFLAEIIAEDYQTQATIALYDTVAEKEVAVFENVSTKDLEVEEGERKFARFTFYIANNFFYDYEDAAKEDIAVNMQYQLKISFGPKDIKTINQAGGKLLLPIGTAEFKNFEIEKLTKENYALADVSSDTRAKKVALTGEFASDFVAPEDEETGASETNDSYNVNVTGYGKVLLETGKIVSLNELSSTNLVRSNETEENEAIIGVVNSKYASTYGGVIEEALNSTKAKLDAIRETEPSTNQHVQALLINNVKGENFVLGNVISIPKNTTYTFSVKVYVHGDATAFVKLVNINEQGADLLNYSTTVTNADSNVLRDGFATVTFVITTGFENYDVRLKFGVEGDNGVALFQSILTGAASTTYTSFEALETALNANGIYNFVEEHSSSIVTYYYASESHAGDLSLALKDDDGAVRKDISSKKEVDKAYATLEGQTSHLVIYNRLNLDDRYIIEAPEADDTTSSEDHDHEHEHEHETESQNYGWLQVTSIIIALALVLALIAVVVRKYTENKNKKRMNTEKYYQGYDKKKYSRSNDVAVPDEDDISKDYDYENPENN